METLRPHWRQPAGDVAWVGEGWRDIVLGCHVAVCGRFPQYELLNIKQKYGVMVFQAFPRRWVKEAPTWTSDEALYLDETVQEFVARSEVVCEWCGSGGRLRDDRSLELTLCDSCDARFSDPPLPGHD